MTFLIPLDLLEEIEKFMKENYITTFTGAVIELIRRGLESTKGRDQVDKYIELLGQNKKNATDLTKYYVYALWNNGEIVYIGQTTQLGFRLITHAKTKDFDEYSYFECDSETDMKAIESSLIIELQPKLNKSLGVGYESLSRFRKRIMSISEEHRYNQKYCVRNLKKTLAKTDVELVEFKGTLVIASSDIPRALNYVLEGNYE